MRLVSNQATHYYRMFLPLQVCGIIGDKITSENRNLSALTSTFLLVPRYLLSVSPFVNVSPAVMYDVTNVSEVSYKFVKSPKFTSTYIESDNQVLHSCHMTVFNRSHDSHVIPTAGHMTLM